MSGLGGSFSADDIIAALPETARALGRAEDRLREKYQEIADLTRDWDRERVRAERYAALLRRVAPFLEAGRWESLADQAVAFGLFAEIGREVGSR